MGFIEVTQVNAFLTIQVAFQQSALSRVWNIYKLLQQSNKYACEVQWETHKMETFIGENDVDVCDALHIFTKEQFSEDKNWIVIVAGRRNTSHIIRIKWMFIVTFEAIENKTQQQQQRQ